MRDISETVNKEGYEKAYEKGEKIIKDYPNCDMLILSVAQILNLYICTKDVKNKEKYETKIMLWYELVASSKDREISSKAIASLVSKYIQKKEYEKAQEFLDKIPPLGYDKRIMQATLFLNEGKNSESYEIYEGMLLEFSRKIGGIIHIIVTMLCKEGKYEDAQKYADIGRKIAEIFELGAYDENISHMFLSIEKKDKEKSLEMIENIINSLETMIAYQKSSLYVHIKFKETNLEPIKSMLKKAFKNDSNLDFIKDEPRFKSAIEKLEN